MMELWKWRKYRSTGKYTVRLVVPCTAVASLSDYIKYVNTKNKSNKHAGQTEEFYT
jgi:hypothetical protein